MKLPPQVFAGDRPEPQKLTPVTNADLFWKPNGGLWTSTHTPDAEHASDWVQWTVGEQFKVTDEAWLLQPADARVAVISDQADLANLGATYKLDLPPQYATMRSFRLLLDYEALARDFDALWMPAPWGQRFNGDLTLSMFFSILDSECALWFHWTFEGEPERLP